ncbi:dihydropteroate synthase [uncultured Bartonella sp.]|uniref:dihydropteroate synthase n=1 Tax=uncultured Bartonella sp. TaxID=104108 RepID=UPI002607DF00|nr:dihydropteroate synthase [uncultured Bartonella sp.]
MKTCWLIGDNREVSLAQSSVLMGILNVTPDSFSDGGEHTSLENAEHFADEMIGQGAQIIDIGGESTRPGFERVSPAEEQARVLPIIRQLDKRKLGLLSIDTYHAETARLALQAGAHIINDIWGLQKEPEMANLVAEKRAGIIIMHNSRERVVCADLIEDQKYFFDKSLTIAAKAGICNQSIVLDPGVGFGKDINDNLVLLKRARELTMFGFPLLAATSRKRFLGAITGHDEPKLRDVATSATSFLLRQAGFSIFRVHNVSVNRDALAVADAILRVKVK